MPTDTKAQSRTRTLFARRQAEADRAAEARVAAKPMPERPERLIDALNWLDRYTGADADMLALRHDVRDGKTLDGRDHKKVVDRIDNPRPEPTPAPEPEWHVTVLPTVYPHDNGKAKIGNTKAKAKTLRQKNRRLQAAGLRPS